MVVGKPVAQEWAGAGDKGEQRLARSPEQGKKVSLKVVYSQTNAGPIRAKLSLAEVRAEPSPEAIAAGKGCSCRHSRVWESPAN